MLGCPMLFSSFCTYLDFQPPRACSLCCVARVCAQALFAYLLFCPARPLHLLSTLSTCSVRQALCAARQPCVYLDCACSLAGPPSSQTAFSVPAVYLQSGCLVRLRRVCLVCACFVLIVWRALYPARLTSCLSCACLLCADHLAGSLRSPAAS
jgi:hypothetical protein